LLGKSEEPRTQQRAFCVLSWIFLVVFVTFSGSQDVLLIFSIDGIDMWSALSTGSPSPRTELLHNIDHDRNVYSLRVKNFKIIIGTTYAGQWDGWYSPEGKNLSYSTSVKAPARVICNPPSDPKILRSCQPLKGPCLFDIEKDPCEYQNLAETQPHVLRKMMDRLKSYNVTVVPPRNQPPDPAGKPQRHRYVWSPWIGY
jgi:arylsulfatase B